MSSRKTVGLEDAWLRSLPPDELVNDLQRPVAARHADITRIVRTLHRCGAMYAAMSGSGSAVFGVYTSRALAERAARKLTTAGRRAVVTRTVDRAEYERSSAPVRGPSSPIDERPA